MYTDVLLRHYWESLGNDDGGRNDNGQKEIG